MSNQLDNLSVFIITRDNAEDIAECLASVRFAAEIIVVDSGSRDETLAICHDMADVVVTHLPWPGFGPQKNYALSLTTKPWVLSIDADERVSDALRQEIIKVVTSDNAEASVTEKTVIQPVAYNIPRRSSFCGQFMHHSGWYPDYVLRLFKRDSAAFTNDLVHESVQLFDKSQSIGKLSHPLTHYSIKDYQQAQTKWYRYAELWAKNRWKKQRKIGSSKPWLSGAWTFIRMFFVQRGLLDGRGGLALAKLSALSAFQKYRLLQRFSSLGGVPRCSLLIIQTASNSIADDLLKNIAQQSKLPDDVTFIIGADDDSGDNSGDNSGDKMSSEFAKQLAKKQQDYDFKLNVLALSASKASTLINAFDAGHPNDLLVIVDSQAVLPTDFIANHYLSAKQGFFNIGREIKAPKAKLQLFKNQFVQGAQGNQAGLPDVNSKRFQSYYHQTIASRALPGLGFWQRIVQQIKGIKSSGHKVDNPNHSLLIASNVAIFRQTFIAQVTGLERLDATHPVDNKASQFLWALRLKPSDNNRIRQVSATAVYSAEK